MVDGAPDRRCRVPGCDNSEWDYYEHARREPCPAHGGIPDRQRPPNTPPEQEDCNVRR